MTIMQNLQYTEHLAEPMAELVTVFAKEFDNDLLGEKVLGCVTLRGDRSIISAAARLCNPGQQSGGLHLGISY